MSDDQYQPVPVEAAGAIARQYQKQQIIILAWDRRHGLTHCTTYGETPKDKIQAAAGGDRYRQSLPLGELSTNFEDFRLVTAAEQAKRIQTAEARVAQLEADLVLKEGQRQTFEDQLNDKLDILRGSVTFDAHDAIVAQLESRKARIAAALRCVLEHWNSPFDRDRQHARDHGDAALADVSDPLTKEERETVDEIQRLCKAGETCEGDWEYVDALLAILDKYLPAPKGTP